MTESLFACTKCHQRFPFEKLSGSLMQCTGCKADDSKFLGPTVCTYCREEYTSKDETSSICPKCDQNVKVHGKPRACEICNIIAAFIGTKCRRCVYSERNWGAPVTCEQCKQKCAFNRPDRDRKVDNKVLCWLCTIAYKKVLAKARKKENSSLFTALKESRSSTKRKSTESHKSSRSEKASASPAKKSHTSSSTALNSNGLQSKISSIENTDSSSSFMTDINIVLVTQLREEVEALKKSLASKEKMVLEKERKITELKTMQMEMEKSHRDKVVSLQKNHNETVDALHRKNKDLLKQLASLSKSSRRGANSGPASTNGSPAIN